MIDVSGESAFPTTAMLGQRVQVTLNREKPLVEGVLLAFGDDGTFIVQDDDGDVQFCWPLLDIVVIGSTEASP